MTSGIYKIICIENNRFYIGKCSVFRSRKYQHLNDLRNNKHINGNLQNDFNLFGETKFEFKLIEETSDNLNELEQKYLDLYFDHQNICYNIRHGSSVSKNPEETRKKQSERSKKMWQNPEYLAKNPCGTSEEKSDRLKQRWQNNREKMLKKLLEETPARKQHKQNFVNQSIKTYSNINLVNPNTGEIIQEITNLREFCKKNSLEDSIINMIIKGKIKQYKGWHVLGSHINQNIKLKMANEKICSQCKQQKLLIEFFKRADKINGYRSKCKQCFTTKK